MIKTRHILGLSGGKDSAALAIHMNNKHPEIDVEYFFTDTGYELPETYKFLDKLKTRLDKEIHVIQPVNSFDYYMKKYNNFLPSQNARWCTIEMKLKAMEKWLKPYLDANDEIVTLIGIRFDERGRTGYKSNNPSIKARFPFIEDMIDRDGDQREAAQYVDTGVALARARAAGLAQFRGRHACALPQAQQPSHPSHSRRIFSAL